MKPGLIASMAGAGLLLLTGCTKIDQFHEDIITEEAAARKKNCRVQKLKVWWAATYREVNFLYNADGNPTDMLVDNRGDQGHSDNDFEYHWRYDRWGRVTDYYDNLRGSSGVFVWHRYFYSNRQTIIDTAFTYSGNINDPVPPNAGNAYGYYAYIHDLDRRDRIIRYTLHYSWPGTPPAVTEFEYNQQGNLAISDGAGGGPVAYDDKINVYRTHAVWPQIYQDYSLNNAMPASLQITQYNDWHLPVKYRSGGPNNPGALFGRIFDSLEVVYEGCGGKKGPKDMTIAAP